MIKAKILKDSRSAWTNVRLITMELCYPRFIHSEFMTHRVFSRNSASSRAVPIEKKIKEVWNDPVVPISFAANKKGMQAGAELSKFKSFLARSIWLFSAYIACVFAWFLSRVGLHKQWANRILEPYSWHTVIVTSTEWDNFFALRSHPDAQPEIKLLSDLMKEAVEKSTPQIVNNGVWHLPLVFEEDLNDVDSLFPSIDDEQYYLTLAKISAARCARVSYLTHDTGKRDVGADLKLYERLYTSGHLSPLEHPAVVNNYLIAQDLPTFHGNFRRPWNQLRKMIPNEDLFKGGNK